MRDPMSLNIIPLTDASPELVPSPTLANLLMAIGVTAPPVLVESPKLLKWEQFLTVCDQHQVFSGVTDEHVERCLKQADPRTIAFDYKETLMSSKFARLHNGAA